MQSFFYQYFCRKIAFEKMAGGRLFGFQKHSTVRPQGGQRLSFQGTVACSGLARGFANPKKPTGSHFFLYVGTNKINDGTNGFR